MNSSEYLEGFCGDAVDEFHQALQVPSSRFWVFRAFESRGLGFRVLGFLRPLWF